MLAAQIFSFGPHAKDSPHLVELVLVPTPPPPRVPWANTKPAGITVELAINPCPPRRSLGEKAEAQVLVKRRTVPRTSADPHIAVEFHRTNQHRIVVDSHAVVRHDAVELRRVPHADLIEQTSLDQPPARHFIAGEDTAHRNRIAEANLDAKRRRDQRAAVDASFIENLRVNINEGAWPRFGLVGNNAVTI